MSSWELARDYGIVNVTLDGEALCEPLDLFNNPDVRTTGVPAAIDRTRRTSVWPGGDSTQTAASPRFPLQLSGKATSPLRRADKTRVTRLVRRVFRRPGARCTNPTGER